MDWTAGLIISGLVLPLCMIAVFVWPFRRIGLNFRGEGYLLFGTQQLLKGQFPIRDFRAYDPARYAWCALFSPSGQVRFSTIRAALAVAQGLALSCLGLSLYFATADIALVAITLFAALLWLRPRHKQLDNLATILTAASLFALFMAPFPIGFLTLGIAVGLITSIGHNHGLYASISSVLLIATGLLTGLLPISWFAFGMLVAGGCVGGLIVALPFLLVKGYASAFWRRKIVTVVKRGTTNLPKPHPWIWTTNRAVLRHHSPASRLFLKGLFTAMPIVFVIGIAVPASGLVPASPAATLALCAAITGLANFHHTLSNAGRNHFSAPVVMAIVTVSALTAHTIPLVINLIGWAVFCGASLLLNWRELAQPYGYLRSGHRLTEIDVLGERLRTDPTSHMRVTRMRAATERWSDPATPALFAPLMPGLYTILDRRPATYDVFSVYPASEDAQATMLAEIKASEAHFAVVSTSKVDNNPDLEFLVNFDQIASYFRDEWTEIQTIDGYRMFVRGKRSQAESLATDNSISALTDAGLA